MPTSSKREQIINKALTLFYHHGFNATGVDKIISEAGVSKKTLYHHFRSKNELVLATLRKRDELFRNNLMRETESRASSAKERLLAIFDVMTDWFQQDSFSGCMFINASAEYAELTDPCHKICAEHKYMVRDYIEGLASDAEVSDPKTLASQLSLLLDGAIVNAYVEGDRKAAERAKTIASHLIAAAYENPLAA